MIFVSIIRNKKGKVQEFTVSGHAKYAKSGSDIVCASVSILVINTINCIERFSTELMEVNEDSKKGEITCVFPNAKFDEIKENAELLVNTMVIGLLSIEGQYSKYIKVTEEILND